MKHHAFNVRQYRSDRYSSAIASHLMEWREDEPGSSATAVVFVGRDVHSAKGFADFVTRTRRSFG